MARNLNLWGFDVLDWLLNQAVANNVAKTPPLLVEFASDRTSSETMAGSLPLRALHQRQPLLTA
jgi:hypothetical protein